MKTLIVITLLILTGCVPTDIEKSSNSKGIEKSSNSNIYETKHALFERTNIDGVDCIIGTGTYDTTVAITCDWANKEKYYDPM